VTAGSRSAPRVARVLILVCDSFGVGGAPDAEAYGDVGSDTLGNTAAAVGGIHAPNLGALGLGLLTRIEGVEPRAEAGTAHGRLTERSAGKDTTTGHWEMTAQQIAKFREFLLRGGFFMCDDFWGENEWEIFLESMKRVFPDRPIVEIENTDQIFHTLFDLDERYQVPGARFLYTGRTYEQDGYDPHWRGIYDDKGRLMAAMCFNMDLGDSWEWADEPRYPEKFSALGIRIGVNYVIYAMTH